MPEEIVPLQHSRQFSPSSLARTERCTAPSVLVDAMPPLPPEDVTFTGTTAHHILETCMKTGQDAWEFIGETFRQGAMETVVDGTMAEELQEGINFLRNVADAATHPPEIEVRLEMPGFPRMFGTADFCVVDGPRVVIMDLKFGYIHVSADALQLAAYALMKLMDHFGEDYLYTGPDTEVIAVTGVLQPHSYGTDSIRHVDWTREQMRHVKTRIWKIFADVDNGVVRWNAGPHCRYCHLAATCPKLDQIANDAVMAELVNDPGIKITGADLDERLRLLPALKLYIKRVEELAFDYLDQGGKLSSAKVVWKRAQRSWADADAAKDWLEKHGVDPYGQPKLKSPAQAEKSLSKTLAPEMAQFVSKQSTGLTLAPAEDPRRAVNRAVSDEVKQKARIASSKISGNTQTRKGSTI